MPAADIQQFALKGMQYLVTGDGKKGVFPGGPRRDLVKSVLDHVFYPMTSINLKQAGAPLLKTDLGIVLGYKLGKTSVMPDGNEAKLPAGLDFYSQEETVWAFLEGIAEKPFVELFVDTWLDDPEFIKGMTGDTAGYEREPAQAFE